MRLLNPTFELESFNSENYCDLSQTISPFQGYQNCSKIFSGPKKDRKNSNISVFFIIPADSLLVSHEPFTRLKLDYSGFLEPSERLSKSCHGKVRSTSGHCSK